MSNDERTPLLTNGQEETSYNGTSSEGNGTATENDGDRKPVVSMLTFLAAASCGILLAAVDATIVTTAYARIGSELNQLQRASWIVTSYMMTVTAFQPLYGKLSDIFGRKFCLLIAHFIFGIGCLGCALAKGIISLVAARFVAGIGGAGLMTVVVISISDMVPLRQRGTWQGILNLIYSVGTASGAPLGGILVDGYGWRWGFAVQLPLCIMGFIAILFAFPQIEKDAKAEVESTSSKLRRVDFLGSLTLVVVVFCLLLGLDGGSNISWTSPIAYVPLTITLVGIVAFVIVESKPSLAKEPVVAMRFFKERNLVACYVTTFWYMGIGSALVFQFALYVQALHRKTASEASLFLLPIIVALVIGNVAGGILVQKTGKYKMLTVLTQTGLLLFTIVNVLIALFRPSWELAGVTVGKYTPIYDFSSFKTFCVFTAMTSLSLFAGIISTTTLVALVASVNSSDQASATAVLYLFRSLGSVVGLSISSAIIQQILRITLMKRFSGSPYDVEELVRRVRESLAYIDSLDPAVQVMVRQSYSQALIGAFSYGTLLSLLSVISSLFIRDRSLDPSN